MLNLAGTKGAKTMMEGFGEIMAREETTRYYLRR